MSLVAVAVCEGRLLALIEQTSGSLEERRDQLERLGVFSDYTHIHAAYARLQGDPVSRVEALKRAVFLQWYRVSEPPALTGIGELDPELEQQVLGQVDQIIGQAHLDHEFASMLAWYGTVTPWYFAQFVDNDSLQHQLQVLHPDFGWVEVATPHSLAHRGQMGVYFSSVLRAQEQR